MCVCNTRHTGSVPPSHPFVADRQKQEMKFLWKFLCKECIRTERELLGPLTWRDIYFPIILEKEQSL